jgi:hypothetical protein
MKPNQIKRAGFVAAVAVACSGQLSPPTHDESAVRALVVREALVEISAWQNGLPSLASERVLLRPLESTASGVQVWEASAPIDHWHRYVVAQRGRQTWRLGGFAVNDLPDYYNAMLREAITPRQQDQIGPYLTKLADPNGRQIVFPSQQSHPDSITRSWAARRPANWPTDTVHVFADGTEVLRITALSKQENSYDQSWVPAVFTFSFDTQGHLLAWHRREGAVMR